jgi:L-ascorbate metabolism protein UlaG (beta-lactamase superfamily)
MRLKLIRSATMRLTYVGHELLTDPYFAPKHSLPSFTGKSPNPLIDLPVPPEDIVAGVDLVLVSHLHTDHFDARAQAQLPKQLPILCQPGDEQVIRSKGFADVTAVADDVTWRNIQVHRVDGQHGSGAVLDQMGEVSGFVLAAQGEPTVYWAGDTILCPPVQAAIQRFRPDIIITHSSGAVWDGDTLIVMDAVQTIDVARLVPTAVVVAIHLDSLDHGTVSRESLREAARGAGIPDGRLLIPADGETLTLP